MIEAKYFRCLLTNSSAVPVWSNDDHLVWKGKTLDMDTRSYSSTHTDLSLGNRLSVQDSSAGKSELGNAWIEIEVPRLLSSVCQRSNEGRPFSPIKICSSICPLNLFHYYCINGKS